jgi:hypothetical protein
MSRAINNTFMLTYRKRFIIGHFLRASKPLDKKQLLACRNLANGLSAS